MLWTRKDMGHHHFTQDGINTSLELQDQTPDSVLTRDPTAEVSPTQIQENGWRCLCGTEMENLCTG